MKITTKAIVFKANGNEIKTATVTLNKWIDHIYYSDPDSEDYNSVTLYIEHSGVFAQVDRISQTTVKPENEHIVKSILEDVEGWLLSLRWINLVHLEFAKQGGLNYDKLLARRNEIIEEREANDRKRIERETTAEAENTERYKNDMEAVKEELKSGAVLPVSKVIECFAFFGFKVHPRTLGAMYKNNGVVRINGATKPKGSSWGTHSSMIQAVKNFVTSF